MKNLLIGVLSYSKNNTEINSVMNTWGSELKDLGARVVVCGDAKQYREKKHEVWFCSARNKVGNSRNLSRKTLDLIKTSLSHPGWDFLLKCDDDTFINAKSLSSLLKTLDPSEPQCLGRLIHNKEVSFFSGGAGFLISRKAIENSLEGLDNSMSQGGPEDTKFFEGLDSSVKIKPSNLFYAGYGLKGDENKCLKESIDSMRMGAVSTHFVKPKIMELLHKMNKPKLNEGNMLLRGAQHLQEYTTCKVINKKQGESYFSLVSRITEIFKNLNHGENLIIRDHPNKPISKEELKSANTNICASVYGVLYKGSVTHEKKPDTQITKPFLQSQEDFYYDSDLCEIGLNKNPLTENILKAIILSVSKNDSDKETKNKMLSVFNDLRIPPFHTFFSS